MRFIRAHKSQAWLVHEPIPEKEPKKVDPPFCMPSHTRELPVGGTSVLLQPAPHMFREVLQAEIHLTSSPCRAKACSLSLRPLCIRKYNF